MLTKYHFLVLNVLSQIIFLLFFYHIFNNGHWYCSRKNTSDITFNNEEINNMKKKLSNHISKSICEGHKFKDLCLYSQGYEDYSIYKQFFSNPIKNMFGTYVELGALDGIRYSNTKFFQDSLLWSGVLIEANPKHISLLKKNRPNNVNKWLAICKSGQKSIQFAGESATGGDITRLGKRRIKNFKININKTITVHCDTMANVLKQADIKNIDFFSLDVEGAELDVLESMDWSIPVKVFLIETILNRNKIITKMNSVGYKLFDRYKMDRFCQKQYTYCSNDVFIKDD